MWNVAPEFESHFYLPPPRAAPIIDVVDPTAGFADTLNFADIAPFLTPYSSQSRVRGLRLLHKLECLCAKYSSLPQTQHLPLPSALLIGGGISDFFDLLLCTSASSNAVTFLSSI